MYSLGWQLRHASHAVATTTAATPCRTIACTSSRDAAAAWTARKRATGATSKRDTAAFSAILVAVLGRAASTPACCLRRIAAKNATPTQAASCAASVASFSKPLLASRATSRDHGRTISQAAAVSRLAASCASPAAAHAIRCSNAAA